MSRLALFIAVRFRNVWVRPLDDRALVYEPK